MEIAIGVSTLHGAIVTIHVDPKELVGNFKNECMDVSPFHLTPLRINDDLAHLMRECTIDDLLGFRVSTSNGNLLDDAVTIGSQVTTGTLLKLVFMKQYELDHEEK